MSVDTSDKVFSQIANVPFVAQIDSSDCGAACLSMAAQHFKVDLILSEARQMCGNDVSGQRLSSVARKLGLGAQFVKKSFKSAIEQPSPFIAHWEGNHWVVIAGHKGDRVKIADPASGIYWLDFSEAERAYSDYCIPLSSDSSDASITFKRDHVLLKCLVPFKRTLIFSAAIMSLIIGVEMFIPYSFQQIIDEQMASREQSYQWLVTYAGMAAVIVVFGYALLSYLLYRGAVKSEKLVLDTIIAKWTQLPENFYKGRSFAELRARLESAFQIKRFLVTAAGGGLFALLEIIAVFAMLEYYGVALKFAILLLPTLILTFYTLYLSKENAGLFKFAKDSFLSQIDDVTRGVFSIRASTATRKFKDLQVKAKEDMYEKVIPLERKLVICEKGAQSLGITAWIMLFFHMCRQYVDNEVSSGVMFAVIILSALALNALSRIINQREKFENAALIYDYLNDVLDTKNDHVEKLVQSGSGALSITDKSGFGVSLEAGQKCIIRGDGRDSLIKHLFGERESALQLSIKCGLDEFQKMEDFPQFSSIESNAYVFNLTLSENVAMGEEVDQAKIKWCLRLALADHLIEELPQGLGTRLRKGVLSRENEQKLFLARCLYRDRPLYILENLSSFLDQQDLLVFAYHLKKHLTAKTVLVFDKSEALKRACEECLEIDADGFLKKDSQE